MDANQLNELANNAELNHWPPHLGVTTDAEKVEYLAARLREAADAEQRADELSDELEATTEEIVGLKADNNDLLDQVATLKADIAELSKKLETIREIVG